MSSDALADFVEEAEAHGGVDSITVVRNGSLVLDAVIHPFPEATAHELHSCTKSVTSTLIGIAIAQGLIAGVDVPVVDLLPDTAPSEVNELKASMTVEDLLTMTAGLDCRDDTAKYGWQGFIEMFESENWAAHVLALPMSEEPGTQFEYCSGASHLLSAILTEATGRSASEYADEVLFEPLGITDYDWPADPQAISLGYCCLRLQPADMAKIGYLYLRNGEWDGEQIVPQAWIETATTTHSKDVASPDGYGYQWWIDHAGHPMAVGMAGQFIIVVPEKDLVVTYNAGLEPGPSREGAPTALAADPLVGFLYRSVLPAIVSDDPLPADPEAEARLAAAVAAAAAGPATQVVELPAIAAQVDGIRYQARPNDMGWEWFELHFGEETGVARGVDGQGPYDSPIGLDGRYRMDDDRPIALRGTWRNDNTFIVEFSFVGHTDRGTFEAFFNEGIVEVRVLETTTGSFEKFTADPVG